MTIPLPKYAAVAALETGFEVEILDECIVVAHPALKKPIPLDAQQARALSDALQEAILLKRGGDTRSHIPAPTQRQGIPENFK